MKIHLVMLFNRILTYNFLQNETCCQINQMFLCDINNRVQSTSKIIFRVIWMHEWHICKYCFIAAEQYFCSFKEVKKFLSDLKRLTKLQTAWTYFICSQCHADWKDQASVPPGFIWEPWGFSTCPQNKNNDTLHRVCMKWISVNESCMVRASDIIHITYQL